MVRVMREWGGGMGLWGWGVILLNLIFYLSFIYLLFIFEKEADFQGPTFHCSEYLLRRALNHLRRNRQLRPHALSATLLHQLIHKG